MSDHAYELRSQLAELSKKYKCSHESSEIRKRIQRDERPVYFEQCLRCGRAVGTAISRAKVERLLGKNSEPPPFNELLLTTWNEDYEREKREILGSDFKANQLKLKNFWQWYNEYLRSPKWLEKRKKVLARAGGLCEGCGDYPATEVHHLTYKNKAHEFLFELVALCLECHEKIHSEHKSKSLKEIEKL